MFIEKFLAERTDEYLAATLAHAQDGKLVFDSCCCLVGIATADHALKDGERPAGAMTRIDSHYWRAIELPWAEETEREFFYLGYTDEERHPRVIEIILGEIQKRDQARAKTESLVEQALWPR